MTTRLLLDAAHPEETRVVVVKGSRLEDFDYESSTKTQLRGNIYLAKVTRVEPSLQAAFVDYGGNRHGFLAFSEIHPDYYQIPIADREKLLAAEAEAAEREAQQTAAEEAAAGETSIMPRADDASGAAAIETLGGEYRSAAAESDKSGATPTETEPPSADPLVSGEAAFYAPLAPNRPKRKRPGPKASSPRGRPKSPRLAPTRRSRRLRTAWRRAPNRLDLGATTKSAMPARATTTTKRIAAAGACE